MPLWRQSVSSFKTSKTNANSFRNKFDLFHWPLSQNPLTNGFLNDMRPIYPSFNEFRMLWAVNKRVRRAHAHTHTLRLHHKSAIAVDAKSRNRLIITCLCQSTVAVSAYMKSTRILNIFMEPVDFFFLKPKGVHCAQWQIVANQNDSENNKISRW